jgi:hypothetical protein
MIVTTKQRTQAAGFIMFINDLAQGTYMEVSPRRQEWCVAFVHGRVVILHEFGGLEMEKWASLKFLTDHMLDRLFEYMERFLAHGIKPLIVNTVLPTQLGRTVSCEFLIDEPSVIVETLKATQHNLTAITSAHPFSEGMLPLLAFRDILEKAIRISTWADPVKKIISAIKA